MRIAVTGATGFIGAHFVRHARSEGADIVSISRKPLTKPETDIKSVHFDSGMHAVPVEALAGCDSLVHLAAHGVVRSQSDWHQCFQVNVLESIELWRKAVKAGVRKLIICGSCFEYGRSGLQYDYIPVDAPLLPNGAYHASKAAASMAAIALAADTNVEINIIRPFHVYGEGEHHGRLWPSLRAAALSGQDYPMTAGDQVRDFTPVEKVVSEIWKRTQRYETIGHAKIENIGTGRPQTVREFASSWWASWNAKGKLLIGALPYRTDEVMRYVPKID